MAIRLMVVDDHAVLREGLQFMLRHEDSIEIVSEASNGADALAVLDTVRPEVILLDMNMPGMDGLETLEHIRQEQPDMAVLILSMYDDPEYVEQALRRGAAGYLLKSVAREELVRAVQAAFAGDGYLQAEITRPVLRTFAASTQPDEDLHLSPREREVLQLVADGMSTKQAAIELDLAESTVKTYLRTLFDKLGASHRAHAVALALRHRIID